MIRLSLVYKVNKHLMGSAENQKTRALNFGAGFCNVSNDSAYTGAMSIVRVPHEVLH
jgi:hypothetical protein